MHVLSGMSKGGGERVAVELANEAAKNNDTVTILAGWPENPDHLQNTIHPNVQIRFISQRKRFAYIKSIGWILANKKLICNQDVLHCHLTFGVVFGAVANFFLKKIGRNKTPIVIETNHAVGMPVPAFNLWLHSLMASQLNGMALMASDPYWNNFIVKHQHLKAKFIPNGISVLTPGIDSAQKKFLLKKFNIPEDYKYIIGTISMLRPDRKPLLYVPLFYEIYKFLGSQVHFILGGSGDEYNKIRILVDERGLSENFHLIGLVNEPVQILSLLDMYVAPSVEGSAGISMIEAALCRVPVAGIQMVEGYEAKSEDWVWSHTDINEVAKKINLLLQNEEERKNLAEHQNKYVTEHFTSEAMYNAYNSFYKQILSSGTT